MLGSTATSTSLQGIVLTPLASSTPNSFYEITSANLFTGAIYGYSQSTSTITCIEE